jgi:hypothetical protein
VIDAEPMEVVLITLDPATGRLVEVGR